MGEVIDLAAGRARVERRLAEAEERLAWWRGQQEVAAAWEGTDTLRAAALRVCAERVVAWEAEVAARRRRLSPRERTTAGA